MRYLLIIATFLVSFSLAYSQEKIKTFDYSEKKVYNIGGIDVIGAGTRDRNAIKSISGLKVGKEISIPGDDVPTAINKLYKLRLFENVEIKQDRIEDGLIYLQLILTEKSTLSRYSIKGIKKAKHPPITEVIDNVMTKSSIVTDDMKALAKLKIREHFIEKGHLDTEVEITEFKDELRDNSVRLEFDINIKEKVKISDITFNGNTVLKNKKLRKKLKETKKKGTFLRKSKFVKSEFEEDKKKLIAHYNKIGYRDATVSKDSVWRDEKGINISLDIDEGNQYFFGNITWKGNTKYSNDQLSRVLGIVPEDVYNPELLEKRLSFSLDGRDVSSLYLDDGYLFFVVDPIELAIRDHTVDIEMQVYEGPQATIADVVIKGNDRTHEHVIRRELRTRPGNKFSRSDIIRSQRSITNLGYFNPESLGIDTPINQQNGTVDIIYEVEERPSDQLELSAGYGGSVSGLIGTLGVSFNNFSLRNIKDKSTWSPLPQGDGQKLSLRAQSNGQFFKSYNISFTEPWLGGKRPTSFTVGSVFSSYDYTTLDSGLLSILRGFVGIGTQLKWPDDYFSFGSTLTLERIKLDNYSTRDFIAKGDDGQFVSISKGNFKNFSLKQVFSRSSVADPIYPRRGSRISLSLQLTPPYSLFRSDNFWKLSEGESEALIAEARKEVGPGGFIDETALIQEAELANKHEWLEYHKWRFDAEWYYNIFDKFVLAANIKFGYLGSYNSSIGLSPFERFEVGGDGLSNQTSGITGKDIISLRGYDLEDIEANRQGGGTIYDKFTLELRYPLSLNPGSSIYMHSFIQGGNNWIEAKDFNPFEMQRSAGFGIRVFLPMFGLLGFDYGWGFDKTNNFGKFSIILGFEPE